MTDQDLRELINIAEKIGEHESIYTIKSKSSIRRLKSIPWELVNQRDVLIKKIEKRLKMDRGDVSERMLELEEKAHTKYQSIIGFSTILECLSEEEQEEYEKLRKELNRIA